MIADPFIKLRGIRIHMADGTSSVTSINGTRAEIEHYYRGASFDQGPADGPERMVKVDRIEFLENKEA